MYYTDIHFLQEPTTESQVYNCQFFIGYLDLHGFICELFALLSTTLTIINEHCVAEPLYRSIIYLQVCIYRSIQGHMHVRFLYLYDTVKNQWCLKIKQN